MNTSNKQAELEKEIIFKAGEELTPMEVMNRSFKAGEKQGRLQAKQDFKENMLMFKSNHQLGCMLECYQSIIENRIGFEKEAKQLLEIASKLK